tara:strand:- start:597 stop:887 length:291 start_codon:yes stop_codon:yes gene_type:complete
MANSTKMEKRLKKILKQSTGALKDFEGDLIPEVAIRGEGHLWCFCLTDKKLIKVIRGIKAHVVDEKPTENGRLLIYTYTGNLVEIDEEELIYTGFD